jgi:hypothetical protein
MFSAGDESRYFALEAAKEANLLAHAWLLNQ